MNFVRLNAATFTDPTDWALEVAATTSASSAPPSIRFCSRAEQWLVVSPKRPTTATRPLSTRPTTSLAAAISVLRTTPTPSPLPQLPALPHWATAKLRWLTAKWNEQNSKLTVVPALACYWFNTNLLFYSDKHDSYYFLSAIRVIKAFTIKFHPIPSQKPNKQSNEWSIQWPSCELRSHWFSLIRCCHNGDHVTRSSRSPLCVAVKRGLSQWTTDAVFYRMQMRIKRLKRSTWERDTVCEVLSTFVPMETPPHGKNRNELKESEMIGL